MVVMVSTSFPWPGSPFFPYERRWAQLRPLALVGDAVGGGLQCDGGRVLHCHWMRRTFAGGHAADGAAPGVLLANCHVRKRLGRFGVAHGLRLDSDATVPLCR